MDRLNAWNRLPDGGRLLVENPQAADLDIPLTNSIIPQRGIGAVTYTRATIATVTDHEWVIRQCISGEARFKWARRVENLFSYSHDYSNAYWSKVRSTVIINSGIGVDGKMTAAKITGTTIGGSYFYKNVSYTAGNVYVISYRVKPIDKTTISISVFWNSSCSFSLVGDWIAYAPSGSSEMSDSRITALANGYYLVSVKFSPTTSAAINTGFPNSSYVGDICYIDWVQLENVTGQSVQTPSEYVSTNVLTATPYHGANVDGVKYFDTDVNWVAIPKTTLKWFLNEWQRTNICTYSDLSATWWSVVWASRTSFAWTVPDGTNSFVKVIPNVWTQQSYIQNTTVTATATVHTISCFVKADWFNFIQLRTTSGLSNWYANYNLSNGTVGTFATWTNAGIDTTPLPWVYRIWTVTDTLTAWTWSVIAQVINSSTDTKWASVTGNGTNGILIWGMQVENWPSVSSYIPTTTTTVTRNTDVLTYDVRNAIANQWALSVVCSMNDNELFDRRAFVLSSFTINRLHVQARSGAPDKLNITYWDGVTVRNVAGVAVWTNNIAVSWTNWVWLNLYMNNIKYIGAFVPNLVFSTIDVGWGALWYPLFWCIKNVRIWKTSPTDAELLALSNSSY